MKKSIKRSLLGTGIIAALLLAFTTGVLAANWKTFEGENNAVQVEENINTLVSLVNEADSEYEEIVKYYQEVIVDLQEQFSEQLRVVTESKDKEIIKLMKDIETLIEENTILKNNQTENRDYIDHLESEVDKANELMQQLEDYSNEAVKEVEK